MSEKKLNKAARTRTPPPSIAAQTSPVPGSPMDVELLQRLVSLMAANDLNTVDVRDGDRRVVLKRGAVQTVAPMLPPVAASVAVAPPQAVAPAPTLGQDELQFKPIKSPMVGTFYAAPSPDAKPFVSLGSVVEEDTDVCIIEAMKVFNNIKAECRGTITKILVENGQPVEFGQVLFLVKPS